MEKKLSSREFSEEPRNFRVEMRSDFASFKVPTDQKEGATSCRFLAALPGHF